MKKLIGIFLLIFGVVGFGWGAHLIHHNYTLQRDVTYILKSGQMNIDDEITAQHSEQALKDLSAHLSFIVFGVVLVFMAFWLFAKAHNKPVHSDRKGRAPLP